VNGERILGFDEESGEFLDYYYYDADAKVIGTSYQQFISAVFADLGFAGLVDRVRVAAKDFEYKYLDIFLAWMEEDDDLSAADAKRVLIQRVAELEASRTSDTGVQAPSALQPKKETHWPKLETDYAYDALNRQTAMTEALGTPVQRTTSEQYDLVENVTKTVDALGRETEEEKGTQLFYLDTGPAAA
jgi:hypothetical protein